MEKDLINECAEMYSMGMSKAVSICEVGSTITVKITKEFLIANNKLIAPSIQGTILSAKIAEFSAQIGTVIGELINNIDPSMVIMLKFTKTKSEVEVKSSLKGDTIEDNLDEERAKREGCTLNIREYNGPEDLQDPKQRIDDLLDFLEVPFLKTRLDDKEFVRDVLTTKMGKGEDKDREINWVLDNI